MRRLFACVSIGLIATSLAACSNPEAARRYMARGDNYATKGQFAKAVIEYENAVKNDPKFGQARYRLAQAYMRTDKPQFAFREYVRAADLMPRDQNAQIQ